jgi:short-subunit dehydrogenase
VQNERSVVITGASGGIGSALAERLVADGWRVLGTARDPHSINAEGVVPIALELTDDDSISRAGATIREHLGHRGLDALVNNAGVIVQGPLALRMELRHQGVAVSLVVPGALETEIFAKAAAAAEAVGPASTEAARLYRDAVAAAAERAAKTKASPVAATVSAIRGALTTRRPKPLYVVDRDARQLELLRRLPTSLRDRVLLSAVGIRADAFAAARPSRTKAAPAA